MTCTTSACCSAALLCTSPARLQAQGAMPVQESHPIPACALKSLLTHPKLARRKLPQKLTPPLLVSCCCCCKSHHPNYSWDTVSASACQVISQMWAFYLVLSVTDYWIWLSEYAYSGVDAAADLLICLFCAEASACDTKGEGDPEAASTSSVYVDIVGRGTSPDTDTPNQLPGVLLQQQIAAAILRNPNPKVKALLQLFYGCFVAVL